MLEKIRIFYVNNSLKFLSLLCGCIIWFGVVSKGNSVTEISLPIKVTNLQDNVALVSPLPQTLAVQLESKAIDLINLKFNKSASVEIDFKDMPLGISKINKERFKLLSASMPNIKMVGVKQANLLNVELDAKIERKVPVQSRVTVTAAQGFTLLGKPEITPDSVYISGARSKIAKIQYIPTEEISLSDMKWNNSLPVKLDLSSISSIVDIIDTATFVQFKIEPLDHKIYTNIPVRLIGSFDRNTYSLAPPQADVEISGGQNLLAEVNPQDINLYIEFTRFSIEDSDELSPIVHISHPVSNWQVLPAKFRLVKKTEESTPSDTLYFHDTSDISDVE